MRPSVVCRWRVRLRKVDKYEEAAAEALEVGAVGKSIVVCSVGVRSHVVFMPTNIKVEGGSFNDAEVRGLLVLRISVRSTVTFDRHLHGTFLVLPRVSWLLQLVEPIHSVSCKGMWYDDNDIVT
jgi:hypothetical protein